MYSKSEALRLHREAWTWVAKNKSKHKADWPGWRDHKARFYCFLCEYIDSINLTCDYCPVQWDVPPDFTGRGCVKTYYSLWLDAYKEKRYNDAAHYANVIANLKGRE